MCFHKDSKRESLPLYRNAGLVPASHKSCVSKLHGECEQKALNHKKLARDNALN